MDKRKDKVTKMKLYYVNINGFQTKECSFLHILETLEPGIFVLTETKVCKGKVFDFTNYNYINRNGTKGQGGLVCAVKKGTFESIRNVSTTDCDNILVCRIEYRDEVVRVICVYGPQETDDSDNRNDFYQSLSIEVEKTLHANEKPIIVGDFNAKLVSEEGNPVPDSPNGGLLHQVLSRYQLQVMNFSAKCSGKWTWSRVVEGVLQRSVLDYFITDSDMEVSVLKMDIDEEKIHCPFHIEKVKGGQKLTYSDHSPIIVDLNILHTRKNPAKKIERRVITEKGLALFTEITEENFQIHYSSAQTSYSSFEKSVQDIVDQCFPKRTIKNKPNLPLCTAKQRKLIRTIKLFSKKGKWQRHVATKMMERVNQHVANKISMKKKLLVEKTVQSVENDNHKFSSNKLLKLMKVLCPKSRMHKSVIVLDNGDEVHGDCAVKEAYRGEFYNRLQPNEMDPLYENYEKLTLCLFNLYINWARAHTTDSDFTYDEVKNIIKSLSNRKVSGLDGIFNEILKAAGRSMITALVDVLNIIKKELTTPEQWNNVQITALFKNSGSRTKLVNFRGIFLSSCVSKLFEKLIKERIRPNLKRISKRQSGATSGKCTADVIFLLNACIDHAKYLNQSLTLLCYDLKQCFDKLWLESCLISLWDLGVQNEWLPLISSMNEKANIVCKTPSGVTAPFTVHNIVKQGTVLGSSLCGAQTAEYGSDVDGFQIGNVNVKPPIFVDDTTVIVQGVDKVVDAHRKAVTFSKRKRSKFGYAKCVYLPINYKKTDVEPYLTIDGHVMKRAEVSKCLGDQFNRKGNNNDLVDTRCKKAFGKTISLISTCEEAHLGKYYLHTLFLLYQVVFTKTLLFNSEGWSHLTAANINKLQTEQLRFLKRVMAVPRSTPNSFIYLELGILPVKHEIAKRQMNHLHHVMLLDHDDPVLNVYNEQRKFIYADNWATRIRKTLSNYNIFMLDEEIAAITKNQWNTLVHSKVAEKAFEDLSRECGEGSKTAQLFFENFKQQLYLVELPPFAAQQVFRVRSRMVKCKANQKDMFRDNLLCRTGCLVTEDQQHIVNCPNIHGEVEPVDMDFLLGDFNVNDHRDSILCIASRIKAAKEYFDNC